MNTHRTTSAYSKSFQAFLDHTDEKPVLLDVLTKRLRTLGALSLLDIGAGNGDLSIPLSKLVERYVAIEQKSDYAERLRNAGLEVIHSPFPCSLDTRFDAVLLSHSLPAHSDGRDGWEPFVSAAWSQTSETGHLLIVTFEDEESEWNDLIQASGLELMREREKRLASLKAYLKTFGAVEQSIITTLVTTKTLDEMVQALAFVWSDGLPEHMDLFLANQKIGEYLDARYKTKDGYAFPFHHYLLDVHR